MTALQLIMAPNPIFRQRAAEVTEFDEGLRALTDQMLEVLYHERGIGLGANMVGVLKRIIVVDLQEEGKRKPLVCINPVITDHSTETSAQEEASLCFPGIRAEITRPSEIEVAYQDVEGTKHTLRAKGWLSTVIQHEMEYLDGRTFLDNLSKMKKDRLLKKMQKEQKHACCGTPACTHTPTVAL